uniref:Exodeoxyribonuclease n=1 Tax=Pseudomonas phage Nican01 TaxID=3138540 RepID=A0AAU6W0B9_9CAUD
MTKQYDLILIDGNSIGYAAHNARVLKHRTGEIQAVFFGLKMMKKAIEQFGTPGRTQSACLWDDKAKWRYALHPEYKGKRDNTPEKAVSRREYKRQVPILRQALSLAGLEQRFAKGDEADDLASAIVHNRTPNQKILLVSGDHDWLQLVSDDVDWFDPRTDGLFVSVDNFEEVTGCKNVAEFAQSKALSGDGSDNISGVGGIGDKAVPLIFKQWGSVPKLFAWADSLPVKEIKKSDIPDELSFWRKKLENLCFGAGRDLFKRNMQLMSLLSKRHRGTDIIKNQVILKSAFNESGFIDLCHEYAFMTIITDMKNWRKTFA